MIARTRNGLTLANVPVALWLGMLLKGIAEAVIAIDEGEPLVQLLHVTAHLWRQEVAGAAVASALRNYMGTHATETGKSSRERPTLDLIAHADAVLDKELASRNASFDRCRDALLYTLATAWPYLSDEGRAAVDKALDGELVGAMIRNSSASEPSLAFHATFCCPSPGCSPEEAAAAALRLHRAVKSWDLMKRLSTCFQSDDAAVDVDDGSGSESEGERGAAAAADVGESDSLDGWLVEDGEGESELDSNESSDGSDSSDSDNGDGSDAASDSGSASDDSDEASESSAGYGSEPDSRRNAKAGSGKQLKPAAAAAPQPKYPLVEVSRRDAFALRLLAAAVSVGGEAAAARASAFVRAAGFESTSLQQVRRVYWSLWHPIRALLGFPLQRCVQHGAMGAIAHLQAATKSSSAGTASSVSMDSTATTATTALPSVATDIDLSWCMAAGRDIHEDSAERDDVSRSQWEKKLAKLGCKRAHAGSAQAAPGACAVKRIALLAARLLEQLTHPHRERLLKLAMPALGPLLAATPSLRHESSAVQRISAEACAALVARPDDLATAEAWVPFVANAARAAPAYELLVFQDLFVPERLLAVVATVLAAPRVSLPVLRGATQLLDMLLANKLQWSNVLSGLDARDAAFHSLHGKRLLPMLFTVAATCLADEAIAASVAAVIQCVSGACERQGKQLLFLQLMRQCSVAEWLADAVHAAEDESMPTARLTALLEAACTVAGESDLCELLIAGGILGSVFRLKAVLPSFGDSKHATDAARLADMLIRRTSWDHPGSDRDRRLPKSPPRPAVAAAAGSDKVARIVAAARASTWRRRRHVVVARAMALADDSWEL